jgi:hypothetical protein
MGADSKLGDSALRQSMERRESEDAWHDVIHVKILAPFLDEL